MIHGDAVRRTDGILTTIALTDRILLIILAVEVELQLVDDLTSLLGQTIFLHQRHHSTLHRSEGSRQLQHHAGLAILEFLLLVSMTHDREEHTIHTDRGLDDIRGIALIGLRIEVLDALARVFLMLREVEVRTRVDTLHLLEAERHLELDIGSGIGIVSQLVVVVETVVLCTEAQSLVPLHTGLLPFREPLQLRARLYEELHLHLLELPHTEDELTGHNLITESLTDLGNTERNLHTTSLLHVQVVHEDTLSRLRTQIDLHRSIGAGTHLGREHQVKLTHIGPVAGTTDRTYDLLVENDLLQLIEIRSLHGSRIAGMQIITLLLGFLHTLTGLQILSLIEAVAEDQHVSTITLLRVAVVDQGIVESIHMSRSLPYRRVHKDGAVDAHDVLVQHRHSLPPILLNIILQLHAVLTIVVNGS